MVKSVSLRKFLFIVFIYFFDEYILNLENSNRKMKRQKRHFFAARCEFTNCYMATHNSLDSYLDEN